MSTKVVHHEPVFVVIFPNRKNDKTWHEYRWKDLPHAQYHASINCRPAEYWEIRTYKTVSENNGYPPWRLSNTYKIVQQSTDLTVLNKE